VALGDLSWDETERDWGTASAVYSESKPVAILGNSFVQFDSGVTFQAGPVEVSLTRTGLTIVGQDRFGQWQINPGTIKEILGMWPVFRAPTGVVVQLWCGAQESTEESITWEGPYDFRVGIDSFQDFLVSGRYMAVRFTSKGQLPWELLSYDLDIVDVGER
jgi:hypothetical protein